MGNIAISNAKACLPSLEKKQKESVAAFAQKR